MRWDFSISAEGGVSKAPVVDETSLRLLLWELSSECETEGLLIRCDFKQTIPPSLKRSIAFQIHLPLHKGGSFSPPSADIGKISSHR